MGNIINSKVIDIISTNDLSNHVIPGDCVAIIAKISMRDILIAGLESLIHKDSKCDKPRVSHNYESPDTHLCDSVNPYAQSCKRTTKRVFRNKNYNKSVGSNGNYARDITLSPTSAEEQDCNEAINERIDPILGISKTSDCYTSTYPIVDIKHNDHIDIDNCETITSVNNEVDLRVDPDTVSIGLTIAKDRPTNLQTDIANTKESESNDPITTVKCKPMSIKTPKVINQESTILTCDSAISVKHEPSARGSPTPPYKHKKDRHVICIVGYDVKGSKYKDLYYCDSKRHISKRDFDYLCRTFGDPYDHMRHRDVVNMNTGDISHERHEPSDRGSPIPPYKHKKDRQDTEMDRDINAWIEI